jgi:site-specific recombinase XerD
MNNNTCPFLLDKNKFHDLCHDFIESRYERRSPKTKKTYYIYLGLFRRWMIRHESTELNEKTIKTWMLDVARKRTVGSVAVELLITTHFLDYLIFRKLWYENPFSALRLKHRRRGYHGMARVLKETGSIAALDELADIPLSGPLASHFTDYFDHVKALGKSLRRQDWLLKSFEKYLRRQNINDLKQIDASVVAAWNDWVSRTPESKKRYKLAGLKDFFDFLLGQERIIVSPIPQLPPKQFKFFPPYVFSREEIRSILAAAEKLPDVQFMPYRGPTFRMVFLLLYTLGLRINEALNLKLADIDFVQDSVTIRDAKFYKGRVLPFGPRFKSALQRYINGHPLLVNAGAEDFLFPTQSCQFNRSTPRLARSTCYNNLNRIIKAMPITPPVATSLPKLHSFRHSFSVHRLENWMREGADIGAKLPLLSAFLGHTSVAYTQVYLTLTPERLALIGQRFEKTFGILPQAEEVRS